MEEEKFEIAKHVYNEYEFMRKDVGDLELDMLEKVEVTTSHEQFELVFLATLFSAWAMREERAYRIWEGVTESYRQKPTSLYDYLLESRQPPTEVLRANYGVPPRVSSNIWETARNLKHVNGDIGSLKVEGSWYRTIENLRNACKGVNQKAFWIARVMRQKEEWDIPGHYCCVSDSHNRALLRKTGFVKSDEDLYNNSRVMWSYFNEPFKTHYYDLPVFRFARNHRCKKCNRQICNLSTLTSC